jgi:hypothetical protein
MTDPVPRIIVDVSSLVSTRTSQLLDIFSTISLKGKKININNPSSGGNLIFGISDGIESGVNFRDWRFKTVSDDIVANYHEVWNTQSKGKYFLVRSYLHLYLFKKEELSETEYILWHCDASEPDHTPHAIYKQSPHIHIEIAQHPIPKAHIALYNGRVSNTLRDIETFNVALKESLIMIDSQILKLYTDHK